MSPNSTVNPSAKKIANIADFVTLFDEPRNDGLFYLETLMYLIQRHQRISNLQMLLQLNKMFSILMPKSKISTLPDHYSNLCSIFFFCRLRPIYIDGPNVGVTVARADKNGKRISAKGIRDCVSFFVNRGHDKVHVCVPENVFNPKLCDDVEIIRDLERKGHIFKTPSQCYDDT